MEIIRLNNVGRRFHKFNNPDEPLETRSHFRKLRPLAGDFWALRNIYMSIKRGEIVGVIGRNGSGKTTLLNIIAGTMPVSEGEVVVNGKISALLTLGAGFQDEFSGRENVYLNASLLGFKKQEIEDRFMSILEFSELGDFINAPLGSYSTGMKMRLGFSVAVHNDFDILVTDEIITVGDISFQKKSFEKMAEFKKQNKSMLLVTQDLGLVERFCDRAYLLEDGKILFEGRTRETIERYEMLLSKKKVLSEGSRLDMAKETKRWATDIVEWGKREGTGEVVVEKVVIYNRWGIKTNRFKPGERIKARVYFRINEEVDNFHFGVAIFREDGVYCYGPNTRSDGLAIKRMGKGKGFFELECRELLFMPGVYYLSVAIWDKDETFAYDYHRCGYKIEIAGQNSCGQLLIMDASWSSPFQRQALPDLACLSNKWNTELKSSLVSFELLECLDRYGGVDSVFVTGRDMKIKVSFRIEEGLVRLEPFMLWLGVYRSDGIYCHGSAKEIKSSGTNSETLVFSRSGLLPGGYRISVGIWDAQARKFRAYSHGICSFNMISEKRDHGTLYLEHRWNWRVPPARKEK